MTKRRKVLIEGGKITESKALRLFERIVGRNATTNEKREMSKAWRAAKLPRPKGPKGNGYRST